MTLEGIPRAVLIVVVSWVVMLGGWAGSLLAVIALAPRGVALRAALVMSLVAALVTNGVGLVVARRAVDRHVPAGPGKTVLLLLSYGMALFFALVEVVASLAGLAR